MRHPFWIINSSLLLLLFSSLVFALFAHPQLPQEKRKKKKTTTEQYEKKASSVAIIDIYTNDLFNTYKQVLPPVKEPQFVKPLPTPPAAEKVHIPEEPEQSFLPPLAITLKGIMTVSDNSNNSAIISDNKTTKDDIYKVGDMVEDAQIIRILPHKVLLVRSNGQQETLYVTQKDAYESSLNYATVDLDLIVKKITDYDYHVDPEAFTKHITSLTDFIETFDITTVYKEGKSIGIRVGKVKHNTLAYALGFASYDIIEKINNISTGTMSDRIKIYEHIVTLTLSSTITVSVLRNNAHHTFTYQLKDLVDKSLSTSKNKQAFTIQQKLSSEELEENKIKLLQKKVNFAPTMQEILIRERAKMLHEGSQERTKHFIAKHGS